MRENTLISKQFTYFTLFLKRYNNMSCELTIDINMDNINKAWKYHCAKLTSDSNRHKFVYCLLNDKKDR